MSIKYRVTGWSASGEGRFAKTVYSKKAASWYRVRGYTIRKLKR